LDLVIRGSSLSSHLLLVLSLGNLAYFKKQYTAALHRYAFLLNINLHSTAEKQPNLGQFSLCKEYIPSTNEVKHLLENVVRCEIKLNQLFVPDDAVFEPILKSQHDLFVIRNGLAR